MEWMNQAMCRQTDPGLFVPEGSSSDVWKAHQQAKRICSLCPVIEQCRDYAVDHATRSTLWGVWGGLHAREIHALAAHRERIA